MSAGSLTKERAMTRSSKRKTWIPKVSESIIRERAERIKPVVRFKGVPHYIEPVDLFTTAFTWDPKAAGRADGLIPLADITTYHTYGYYAFFKPSIAEVVAQIPKGMLDKAVAFEIVERPESADDLNDEREALNAGYHVATTRLYGKA